MADFVNLRLVAERLIEANGRTVVLSKRDRAADDLNKPWRGPTVPGTDVTVTVIAAMFDFEAADIDGEIVRRGDKTAFIAAKSVDDASTAALKIETFDKFTDETEVWKIVSVNLIAPSTLRVLYIAHLRK